MILLAWTGWAWAALNRDEHRLCEDALTRLRNVSVSVLSADGFGRISSLNNMLEYILSKSEYIHVVVGGIDSHGSCVLLKVEDHKRPVLRCREVEE